MFDNFKNVARGTLEGIENTLEKLEQNINGTFGRDLEKQVQFHKDLLVDMQMEHLYMYREYQALFAEKENEIQRLRDIIVKHCDKEVVELAKIDPSQKNSGIQNKEEHFISKSEYDADMRILVNAKTDALAEIRTLNDKVRAANDRLTQVQQMYYDTDSRSRHLEMLEKTREAMNVQDSDVVVGELSILYAKLTRETEEQRQYVASLRREKEALTAKLELKEMTIERFSNAHKEIAKESATVVTEEEVKVLQVRVNSLQKDLEEGNKRLADFTSETAQFHSSLIACQMENKELLEKLESGAPATAPLTKAVLPPQAPSENVAELQEQSLQHQQELEACAREAEEKLKALEGSHEDELKTLRSTFEAEKKELLSMQSNELQEKIESSEKTFNERLQAEIESITAEHKVLLNDMQQSHQNEKTEELKSLQEALEKQEQESVAEVRKKLTEHLESEISALKDEHENQRGVLLENHETELNRLKEEHETVLATLDKEHKEVETSLLAAKQKLEDNLARAEREFKEKLDNELAAQEKEMSNLHEQSLEALKIECNGKVAVAENKIGEYKDRFVQEAKLRKQIHNDLIDIRGNIRVYCRVRPILPVESNNEKDSQKVVEFPVDNEVVIKRDDASVNQFEFDGVLQPESTQEEVFADVSPLVTSVMDGYNVCIFAYGQTGSGKTYTMEGPAENRGVNFRALKQLFDVAVERKENFEYEFKICILEIYNENVFDLLSQGERKALDIRLNAEGKVHVKGITELPVEGMDDVEQAMTNAHKNRSVGSHNMNEHSSRSHLVLTVEATYENKVSGECSKGKLNLIDLAGSERVSKTDASGSRLKEAQNINKSLSALGDVISALGERKGKGHVPFRNSKLTYLLQPSLGGNSKVAMFVNISPVQYNANESVCSLNFAHRCRKVELGGAKKNGSSDAALAKYKKQISDLQNQIASMQRMGTSSTAPTTPRKSKQ